MSGTEISKVLAFPIPINSKQLKSFLGLANNFRPHNEAYMLLNYS